MDKDLIVCFLKSQLTKETIEFFWKNTNNTQTNDSLEVSLKELVLMDNKELFNEEEIINLRNHFENFIYTISLQENFQFDVVSEMILREKAKVSLEKNPIYVAYGAVKKMLLDFKVNSEKKESLSGILLDDMSSDDIELYNEKYNYERKLSEREIKLIILNENKHLLSKSEINFFKDMLNQQLVLHKRNKDEVIEAIYNDYDPVDLNGPYIYSLVVDDYIHTQEEVSAKFRLKTLMANKHMFSDEEYKYHYSIINNELILASATKKTFIK